MPDDWMCHVCGEPVAWGDVVCELCGAALEWEEVDEDDPDAVLMPPWWEDEDDLTEAKRRRSRSYALIVVSISALAIMLGAVMQGLAWYWLFVGAVFLAAGVYALVIRGKI